MLAQAITRYWLCSLLGLGPCLPIGIAYAKDSSTKQAEASQDASAIATQINLAQAALNNDQIDQAVLTIRNALQGAHRSVDKLRLHSLAIEVEIQRGNLAAASEHYRVAKSIRSGRSDPELHLAMAKVYLLQGDFEHARGALQIASDIDEIDPSSKGIKQAAVDLNSRFEEIVQAIAYRPLALAVNPQVNRAQAAAFLINELHLDQVPGIGSAKKRSKTNPGGSLDYTESVHRDAIDRLDQLGLRGLNVREGHFYPVRPLTRLELALLVEDLLYKKLGQSRSQYLGSPSPFSDIDSNSSGFNAMMTAVSRGILKANSAGQIDPDGNVSGALLLLTGEKFSHLITTNITTQSSKE